MHIRPREFTKKIIGKTSNGKTPFRMPRKVPRN